MARYFFDLVKQSVTAHDHQGRVFEELDEARRQGEIIAMDLQYESDEWAGGQVSVRDQGGQELFSIPVPAAE